MSDFTEYCPRRAYSGAMYPYVPTTRFVVSCD
uniref:Uncharacterized protein n=1 Tax=Arundo donax TaxID=35708 RepID=A0A0A9BRA0_ARUDO